MGYTVPTMAALLHVLNRNAKAELVNGKSVNLLNVAFEIETDPSRPDDENVMRRNLHVENAFSRDISWINAELDAIRNLCSQFYNDFDRPAETLLRATLLARRYEIEEVKEWNTSRPLLALVTPMVGIWALGWTVRLENAENPAVDRPKAELSPTGSEPEDRIPANKIPVFAYSEYLNDGAMDAETLKKVRERIYRVNEIMKGIISRLTDE